MVAHPRLQSRGGPPAGEIVRTIVLGASSHRWLDELEQQSVVVQIGRTVAHVVSALVEDPPPRPQVLIVDLDDVTPGELVHLHAIRDQGWLGTLIATGDVPRSLRASLRIDHVLRPDESLHGVIGCLEHAKETRRIPRITG